MVGDTKLNTQFSPWTVRACPVPCGAVLQAGLCMCQCEMRDTECGAVQAYYNVWSTCAGSLILRHDRHSPQELLLTCLSWHRAAS